MSRMSASTWMATEKASRTCMPEEKFFSFRSMNSSSSVNATMSSSRASASLRLRPSMTALMIALSRAVSSALKPTPSSMNGARRPSMPISPLSMP